MKLCTKFNFVNLGSKYKMISELDLRSLWKELDDYEVEMEKETKSLQEVWVKIAQLKASNEADLNR